VKKLAMNKRTLTLALVLIPLLLSFVYVVARSGPLAPVSVTVTQVEVQAISPALFGIGIVEARYSYRIGPSMTGRVLNLAAQVGDKVHASQVLGDIDPVDMGNKITSKDAAIKRAQAVVIAAQAQVKDSSARETYAQAQSQRYQLLVQEQVTSEEAAEAKLQEYKVATANLAAAKANLNAAREELEMQRADLAGLVKQGSNLRLVSPVDGLVVGRYVEPGSTVVAGQAVLEVIDPASIWVNVRFDQLQSSGLDSGLAASIRLRSSSAENLSGQVARVEPLADAVTEEILAKVVFDLLPEKLPPIGELAEVTVALAQRAATAVVPNAAIKHLNGNTGVWLVENNAVRFVTVETGANDLDGRVQILSGLEAGDQIVVYSKQELTKHSRIKIVDRLVDSAS
jgi:RND family efflux transporter MFP subunit